MDQSPPVPKFSYILSREQLTLNIPLLYQHTDDNKYISPMKFVTLINKDAYKQSIELVLFRRAKNNRLVSKLEHAILVDSVGELAFLKIMKILKTICIICF